jgi:lysophospholipase L1-like esterase
MNSIKTTIPLQLAITVSFASFLGAAPAQDEDFLLPPNANVVMLGDSITSTGTYGQIMQELIHARFPDRNIRILARGANGDTAHGAHRRVDLDVAAWRPAWVLVNFGINEARCRYTPEQFLTHYESLLNAIQRYTGGTNIAIVSPFYSDRKKPLPQMDDYVQGLQNLADKYNYLYIPLWKDTQAIDKQLPDGVDYGTE